MNTSMNFTLPSLPYDYHLLEPYVDKETMFIHHTKHHQTYVDNLNKALGDLGKQDMNIIALQQGMADMPVAVRNNGGGHYNHSFFWKVMTPVGTSSASPTGELKAAISEAFGSFESMKEKFTQAALTRFGSGWAWLGVKPDGTLDICSTPNQDNPLMKGIAPVDMIPILGLDVWEHAYYLKYQNRRPEYIKNWWPIVNWEQVAKNYGDEAKKGIPVSV